MRAERGRGYRTPPRSGTRPRSARRGSRPRRVSGRPAGRDGMPGDTGHALPAWDRAARRLGARVRKRSSRLAAEPDGGGELAGDARAGDGRAGRERQALARVLADHCEDAASAAPGRRRPRESRGSTARPGGAPAAAPPPHGEALFLVEAAALLVVHDDALALEHQLGSAVAEAAALSRIRACISGQSGARSRLTVSGSRPVRRQARREPGSRGPASPVTGRRPPRGRRRQLFPSKSFSTALSSI